MQFFSRVGIPREILTDCGTNFTSRLMKELYSLLQVKSIRISPYHPQTDGRVNGTMKSMLRKVVQKFDKQWDKALPYLMFAYREESTGFSPFELLYGRQVRGPLDILRETLEQKMSAPESVISYISKIHNRLGSMHDIGHQKEAASKREMKKWYDKTARARSFEVNEPVLVLLPSESN